VELVAACEELVEVDEAEILVLVDEAAAEDVKEEEDWVDVVEVDGIEVD
jgi:hypothetical protein